MKLPLKSIIVIGIIVLVHLWIAVWLSKDNTPKIPATPHTPPTEQTIPATPQPTVAPAKPAVPAAPTTPAKPAVKAPAQSTVQTPAALPSAGKFTMALRTMPDNIKKVTDTASAVLIIDQDKRQVMWEKSSSRPLPIASLTKLMTVLLLMEDVTAKKVSLEDTIKVTNDDKNIMKRWGHGCYIAPGESYTLQELLKATLISSANDCAYLAARYLSGTNEKFVERMNQRAKELGLSTMRFYSVNGHPNVGGSQRLDNYSSAMDMAILADMTTRYPEIMKWAGTKKDSIRETAKNPFDLNATNHLFRNKVPGVTGLKTGYTDAAGHCMVVTCEREGRRIMIVILGVHAKDQGKLRDAMAKTLLQWAYNN